MKISATGPGRLEQQERADDRQRQDDGLDPARHDHRLDGATGAARGGGRPRSPRRGVARRVSTSARAGRPARSSMTEVCAPARTCAPGRCSSVCVLTAILFVGDVVGSDRPPRRPRACSATCATELGADFVVVNGENASGGIGITPEARRRAVLGRRRRDHARQPHLPPPRGLAVPRGAPRDHPARQLPARPAGPRHRARRARGHDARRRQPRRQPLHEPRRAGAARRRRGAQGGRRAPTSCSSTCTPRRRARRSRSAGTSTARVAAVVGTHTHVPTADARVLPRRDRLHHRRRHDRRARRRDRRAARAVDRGHAHAHAAALRPGRGRPVDQRGAHPLRPDGAARRRSSRCCVREP